MALQKNSQLQKLNLLWMFSQFSKPYMIIARDDEENNLASVVQVACHTTVLLFDKYLSFSGACDIYIVAIDKHPA